MATSSPPPESSQRPLNPEMVYAPLTPRDSTDGLVGNDDDSDDHTPTFRIPLSCRLPASLVTVLRATVLVFSFVDCIFWAEELTYSSVYRRLIFISLLFLTLWTLSLLGYNRSVSKHLCRGGGGGRFSCQIGPLRCILGDSDDDYDEDNGDEPPKERKVFRLSWAVDLTFAIMLLVLGILQQIDGRISWKYHSHDYPRYFVLLYMVVWVPPSPFRVSVVGGKR